MRTVCFSSQLFLTFTTMQQSLAVKRRITFSQEGKVRVFFFRAATGWLLLLLFYMYLDLHVGTDRYIHDPNQCKRTKLVVPAIHTNN